MTRRPMARCDVFDVVTVPFPYTDRPVRQHRPALVVAEYRQTGVPVLLWVLMITSARHRRRSGDVEVSDFAASGLPVPSIVRSAKIATIEETATRRIGSLPLQDRPAVARAVAERLGNVLRADKRI